MSNIRNSLESIGFSNKKARIYLAILELGRASVVEIAKKAELKRTTVYNLLPEMILEGLVKTGVKKNRKFYFVDDVRRIARQIEDKKQKIESILPELRAIHNVLPQKPRITYYEGVGGMKELYQDTLDSTPSGGTIRSYTGLTDFYKLVPFEYYRWYVEQRIKRKIRLRVIAHDSRATRDWKEKSQEDLREVKIVGGENFVFNADTEIYANKVALISYRENFLGVVIESKEINEMQKSAFELMWDSL